MTPLTGQIPAGDILGSPRILAACIPIDNKRRGRKDICVWTGTVGPPYTDPNALLELLLSYSSNVAVARDRPRTEAPVLEQEWAVTVVHRADERGRCPMRSRAENIAQQKTCRGEECD